jgi:hypothetical protein
MMSAMVVVTLVSTCSHQEQVNARAKSDELISAVVTNPNESIKGC